jgi:diguanylate cyclase (GGDEF)-like protein/PAS domain S-box-containing protein
MERRPYLLALLLGFAFLAMVAGRETYVRRQSLGQAQAVAAELQRVTADGAKLSAADLAGLAQPLGFDRAELHFAKGAAWTWEAPERPWAWFPRQSLELPVSLWGSRADLTLARAPTQWWLYLGGAVLMLGLAWGLRLLQRALEQERSSLDTALMAETRVRRGLVRELRRRLESEQDLGRLLRRLREAEPNGMDQALKDVLGQLGSAVQSDWAVLFLYFDGGSRFGATHSWSDPSAREADLEGFASLATDAFPWLKGQLDLGEPLQITGLDGLPPEAAAERYLLQLQGVRDMVLAPLRLGEQALGFVGCAHLGGTRHFANPDAELMGAAADAMAELIARARGQLTSERLAAMERLSGDLAHRFLEAGDGALGAALSQALERLGRLAGAGRAGLWVLEQDGQRLSLEREWNRPEAGPTAERDRNLAAAALPGLLKGLRKDQAVRVVSVEGLGPDFEPERLELKRRGVTGAVLHGLFAGGHLLGYLELDRVGAMDFTEAAAPAAASVAAILASALQRERSDAALRASEDRAKALLAGLPDALLRLSAEGRIIDARFPKDEKALAQPLLGLGLAQLPNAWKGMPEGAGALLQAALQTALRTGRPQSVDLELGQGDTVRYLEWRLLPQGASEATALLRDRTVQRRQEMEHERQLGNLLAIFNAGSRGLMLFDADGSLQAFNQAAARSAQDDLGLQLQAGMRLQGRGHPETGEAMGRQFAQALKGEEPEMERDFPLPNGRSRLMRVQHLPVFGEDGSVRAVCVSLEYLDRLKETQDALRVSEERYALAAQGSKDGLWDLDLVQGSLYVSPRLEAMLGLDQGAGPKDLQAWLELAHPEDRDALHSRLAAHLDGRTDHFEVELRLRHASLPEHVWMLLRGMAVRDATGRPVRVAGSQTDIHLRKMTEQSLLRDALLDPLTGLPNRALVVDRLGRCQARAKRRKGYAYALLYLDTDDFKTINQSLGTLAGDRLLKELAGRLESCLRPGDTVGRLGGDEFAVLLDDLSDPSDAEIVANRVLDACRQPMVVMGKSVVMSVSIGIALADGSPPAPSELLRNAETAMVQAKAAGRSQWRVFEPGMLTAVAERLDLELGLREALDQGQLRLHYQPIVELATGRMGGLEGLARWTHPQRGLVMPAEFIPVAEDSGLILPLGRWVLREGLRQLAEWRAQGAPEDLVLSLNLSPRQLEDPELLPEIQRALHSSGAPANRVQLEVTESVFMSNRQLASHVLGSLRDMGFSIAIDDFGTGYSSLSYLHQFPAQALKIDRSFVSRMDGLPENEAVTSAVVMLGQKLGLKLVAEGIETPLQASRLAALGCPWGQGYWYSKPRPAEQVPECWKTAFAVPPAAALG